VARSRKRGAACGDADRRAHEALILYAIFLTNHCHPRVGGSAVMRTWYVASAFAVIVAGSSFYAVVGSPFAKVGPKADAPVHKADAPVDTVHLFSAPKDVPHAPPTDLIAAKLAVQLVIRPPPKVKPAPPKPKVQEPHKPKAQAKKPGPPKKLQAQTKPKPKKPVTVTGSL
jgi:outer membrane biosynthesis protein TonB